VGGVSIFLGAAFFHEVNTCYIILHCKEQQVTSIYLLVYLKFLFVFYQLDTCCRPFLLNFKKEKKLVFKAHLRGLFATE